MSSAPTNTAMCRRTRYPRSVRYRRIDDVRRKSSQLKLPHARRNDKATNSSLPKTAISSPAVGRSAAGTRVVMLRFQRLPTKSVLYAAESVEAVKRRTDPGSRRHRHDMRQIARPDRRRNLRGPSAAAGKAERFEARAGHAIAAYPDDMAWTVRKASTRAAGRRSRDPPAGRRARRCGRRRPFTEPTTVLDLDGAVRYGTSVGGNLAVATKELRDRRDQLARDGNAFRDLVPDAVGVVRRVADREHDARGGDDGRELAERKAERRAAVMVRPNRAAKRPPVSPRGALVLQCRLFGAALAKALRPLRGRQAAGR